MMPSNQGYGIHYSDERVSSGQITNIIAFLVPPSNQVVRRGFFQSRLSIILSTGGKFHVTISHDALDLTVQGIPLVLVLPPGHGTSPYRATMPPGHWTSPYKDFLDSSPSPQPGLAFPSSDIWWPRLDTCSNLFTWASRPVLKSGGQDWRSVQFVHLRIPNQCCQLVAIEARTVGARGWYTSYWNAVLFSIFLSSVRCY